MLTLKDYTPQNTKGIAGLSNQLCAEAVGMGFLERLSITNLETDSDSLVHLYLHPVAAKALRDVCTQFTDKLVVSTAYRTLAQQFILKQNLRSLVANVGRSDHGNGKSLDITNWNDCESILSANNWNQSYPNNDAVHWDCDDVPDNRVSTVIAFQRLYNRNSTNKISENGSVDAATMRALANSPACGFQNALTPRFLSLGATGKDVAKYQLVLRDMKLYTGAYDGIFGSGMQEAIIKFQTRYKLDVTGIIGFVTGGQLSDYPDIEVPA
jgi:N-acetylmuramoyl-L-alanine amidase